jgi:hypothetical protein
MAPPRSRPVLTKLLPVGLFPFVVVAACGGGSSSTPTGPATHDSGHAVAVDADREDHSVHVTPAVDAGHDASVEDATVKDATRDVYSPKETSTVDVKSSPADATEAGIPDVQYFDDYIIVGDVMTVGPPIVDATTCDAASGNPDVDACDICNRTWVCNGFADPWVSTSATSCAYFRGCTAVVTLYCVGGHDTIDYSDPTNNDGTWATTSTGLALYYNDVGGGTVEIDCVPPS